MLVDYNISLLHSNIERIESEISKTSYRITNNNSLKRGTGKTTTILHLLAGCVAMTLEDEKPSSYLVVLDSCNLIEVTIDKFVEMCRDDYLIPINKKNPAKAQLYSCADLTIGNSKIRFVHVIQFLERPERCVRGMNFDREFYDYYGQVGWTK